ncbi:MAG TPA: hypothetical protein PKE54_06420 [Candidatus Obscuribacter sp.]|nr:hypothetical protein [Candidatus Obscuribacter sp.]HMW89632.1 hypothetical protein [Candidatus Obscuribacter sp.]HND07380.1 hypothetical protein [Candidatus Obscuribacter sp.]
MKDRHTVVKQGPYGQQSDHKGKNGCKLDAGQVLAGPGMRFGNSAAQLLWIPDKKCRKSSTNLGSEERKDPEV